MSDLPRLALAIARQNSIRLNPDLLEQYVYHKIGGLKRQGPVPISTVQRWVSNYDMAFNRDLSDVMQLGDKNERYD
jgi:hypothetical protein